MKDIDVHQGRDPEKVGREYEAVVKLAKWVTPILVITALLSLFN